MYRIILYFAVSCILLSNTLFAQSVDFSNIKENSADVTISLTEKAKTNVFVSFGNVSLPNVNDKSINKDEKKISSLLNDLKSGESIAVLQFESGKKSFSLKKLNPGTRYYFVLSQDKGKNKEFSFVTMAAEPAIQTSIIGFKNVSSNSMELVWKRGNGKSCIVIASKDKEPEMPKDGNSYTASEKYGSASSKVGTDSYIVYSGSENFCKVSNLEFGTYYFRVFEFNGENESANYNLDKGKGNPRFKMTSIEAPKANPALIAMAGAFKASWSEVKGAVSYEIQVAYDPKFKEIDETYNNADVGNITAFELVELNTEKKYYYRVRTVGASSKSEYSNIVKVE